MINVIEIAGTGGETVASVQASGLFTITGSWQKVTIPLSSFSSQQQMTQVTSLNFRFAPSLDIEVKEVQFSGGSTPFVYFGADHPNIRLNPAASMGTFEVTQ